MNVLVACEESQRVCNAFRERGHNAFSCDILPCSGGHPEWHIQGDVLEILNPKEHPQAAGTWHGGYKRYSVSGIMFATCDRKGHWVERWDLIIAFPPCTHLAVSGARYFEQKRKDGRQQQGIDFFMEFTKADCEKIAIENPIGIMSTHYRKPNQIIQPWMFGHGETKATCLWLKNLPELKPTNIVDGREQRIWRMPPSPDRAKERSKTFPGIAKAMAEQWG